MVPMQVGEFSIQIVVIQKAKDKENHWRKNYVRIGIRDNYIEGSWVRILFFHIIGVMMGSNYRSRIF